jgi:methylase of polypeptide subunit release factors
VVDTVKDKRKAEFGDFQTPPDLAEQACHLLRDLSIEAASIVEPNCGEGNFLSVAVKSFPSAKEVIGADINPGYINLTRQKVSRAKLRCEDFFKTDWHKLFSKLPEPILLVGNPPWVTNADLGLMASANLPVKQNFQNRTGLDAVTGKSNFDISEWMLIHELKWLQGKKATLAMLCKTAVARKVLRHAWQHGFSITDASIYRIDAFKHFDAAVDACFLICTIGDQQSFDCNVFDSFDATGPINIFGYRDGQLVANVEAYERLKHLQGTERYKWRSGIKHDCSPVMELKKVGDQYTNGLGALVSLEPDCLYPMLKSSNVARGDTGMTDRFMLVPQMTTGGETESIAERLPLTWSYLQQHGKLLDLRGSSIYKKRPRFSIFGVGPYSFLPWKVAISGFYKSLAFRKVGPIEGKPTVFDDTVNFISCTTEEEADLLATILKSSVTAELLSAFIFWDAKRPLTIELLRKIDVLRIAEVLRLDADLEKYLAPTAEEKQKEITLQTPFVFEATSSVRLKPRLF